MHMVRIWLTEECNALCQFCMNAHSRGHAQMNSHKFMQACAYFKDNGFDKIAIMGGEPTLHQDFSNCMRIAQKYFECVYLYTNAILGEKLSLFSPRNNDTIIYNFNFGNSLTPEKLLLDLPGERILEVIINADSNIYVLKKELCKISLWNLNKIKIQIVLNNSSNIFKDRNKIALNINRLYKELHDNDLKVSFECAAPLCFTQGIELPPHKNNTICPQEAILLDGNFNACFCNIYSEKLINLFSGNDLIPFSILRNYINMESLSIKEKCLKKICKDCLYFNTVCNGKCHIGQDIISTEDVKKNTSLPWLKITQ